MVLHLPMKQTLPITYWGPGTVLGTRTPTGKKELISDPKELGMEIQVHTSTLTVWPGFDWCSAHDCPEQDVSEPFLPWGFMKTVTSMGTLCSILQTHHRSLNQDIAEHSVLP